MAASPPICPATKDSRRAYNNSTFSPAIGDTYLTYGDFNYVPSPSLSHVVNNGAVEEPEFDDSEFIIYERRSASEEQYSITAHADSFKLLLPDGSNPPTTEIREDNITNTLCAEKPCINPAPLEFLGVLAGCGAQFDNAFTTCGAEAFFSNLPTSDIHQIEHHYRSFDVQVHASLRQSSALLYYSANDSKSGYPVHCMPLIPQATLKTTLSANITPAQLPMTIYDAGTGMPLNLQGYLANAMYPAATPTEPTTHPDEFGNGIQVGLNAEAGPSNLPPQGSSQVRFPRSGPYEYPTPANYPPPAQQPYAPTCPAPTPMDMTLVDPAPAKVGGFQTAPSATVTRLCSICNKGPFDASALAKHKNSAKCQKAAGKTPMGKYACPYCAHTYPRQDHLKRHLLKIIRPDNSEKPPTCEDLRTRDANGQIDWETEMDPKTGAFRLHEDKGVKCRYQMPRAYKQYMQTHYGGRHGQ
jgi:hypothetical protein